MSEEVSFYENKEVCRVCGGECCQYAPGKTAPEDWGAPNIEIMEFVISRVLTATDKWRLRKYFQSDGGYLYIKPSVHNDKVGYLGPCIFWDPDSGCELIASIRPYECRMLIPGGHDKCELADGMSTVEIVRLWEDYQTMMCLWVEKHGLTVYED